MMHNYNTIIGVIGLRNNKVSYPTIRQRYGIGNSGIDLIMNRYKESGLSWEDFLKLEPSQADKDREQVALDNLVEEIADVEIMLEQVKDLLQIPEEDIEAIKLYKVNRTRGRIADKG